MKRFDSVRLLSCAYIGGRRKCAHLVGGKHCFTPVAKTKNRKIFLPELCECLNYYISKRYDRLALETLTDPTTLAFAFGRIRPAAILCAVIRTSRRQTRNAFDLYQLQKMSTTRDDNIKRPSLVQVYTRIMRVIFTLSYVYI